MKRYEMIKDKKVFNNIIQNGFYKKNNLFIIYTDPKKSTKNKFGIAISKKIGKAHYRNYLKRQTRMIIDRNRNLFQKTNDYIIMIRKGCCESSFKVMEDSFISLIKEIKVKS